MGIESSNGFTSWGRKAGIMAGVVLFMVLQSVDLRAEHAISSSSRFATGPHSNGTIVTYDYARVVSVEPILRVVRVSQPRETCWQEEVVYRERVPHVNRSPGIPLVGAVLGGAFGNAVGHSKRNKQVGTVVGAILGASLAAQAGSSAGPASYRDTYGTQQRCQVNQEWHEEEKTTGYWVSYVWRGQTYRSRLNYHPGERLRVRLKVSPVG